VDEDSTPGAAASGHAPLTAGGNLPTNEPASVPAVPYLPPVTRLDSSSIPRPVRTVAPFDRVVVGGTRLSPSRRRRGPRAGTVLAVLLLVAGCSVAFVVVKRRSEATGNVSQAESPTVTTTSTPLVDGLTTSTTMPGGAAAPVPTAAVDVVPATTPAPTTAATVQQSKDWSSIVTTPDPAVQQRVAQCRLEQGIVFTALQAFVYQTGNHPENPDALAAIGRLQADPRGWNSRWAFHYTDQGIYVVPVRGGACDL